MTYSRPVLAAPVAGFAAVTIARLLDGAMPNRLVALQSLAEAGKLHPDRVAEVASAWAAIREAARQWDAAGGSTADPAAAVPPRSKEIDTDRAAGLLGVTPNRVRQLARSGDLPGRKVARVWLVDRRSVEMRRECNGGLFR